MKKARQYRIQDLGMLLIPLVKVRGMNSHGEIVGSARNPATGGVEACIISQNLQHLGTLGGSQSTAEGINDLGEIVGGSLTRSDDEHHAILISNKQMYDLNDCLIENGWQLVHALAINNQGHILGVGLENEQDHLVLLVPAKDNGRRTSS